MNIQDIPAGPIGAGTRRDPPEEVARRKRETARDAGWETPYTSAPYPWLERATDIEFAKGYGEGLLAKVENLGCQEREDAE